MSEVVVDSGADPSNTIALAGILGRIEANLTNLATLTKENTDRMREIDTRLRLVETAVAQQPDGERVRKLEATVEALVATKPVRTPWYTIIAGIAGIGGIITGFVYVISLIVSAIPV